MSEIAPNQVEHTVLWAGGWDTYLIDLNETIDAPSEAFEGEWWKHHINRTFVKESRDWLACHELNHSWYNGKVLAKRPEKGIGVHPDSKGVRIIKHLGGGD